MAGPWPAGVTACAVTGLACGAALLFRARMAGPGPWAERVAAFSPCFGARTRARAKAGQTPEHLPRFDMTPAFVPPLRSSIPGPSGVTGGAAIIAECCPDGLEACILALPLLSGPPGLDGELFGAARQALRPSGMLRQVAQDFGLPCPISLSRPCP
jgi:hypothetical protein